MAPIKVFEDPWPRTTKDITLGEAAVLHLQVSNFFLKLLAHFPSDHEGRISDDALVYSEWRYIVYLRFLQRVGLSPHEVPPPWDVALIWYCHLMSTIRFHGHLIDSRLTAYGMHFTQFPLIELSSLVRGGKWSNGKAQTEWDKFVKQNGYDLSYQLWPHTPWEDAPAGGGLSRLFRKSPASGSSRRWSKVAEKESEEKFINIAFDPQLRRCVLQGPRITKRSKTLAISSWPLQEYAERRSRPLSVCDQTIQHQKRREMCTLVELTPWPTIHDTKSALYRQVAFWTALSKAQTSQPEFIKGLSRAEPDYVHFMSIFRHRSLRPSQLDPHARETESPSLRLVPPTLEVDLLWHTHRLHPGSYWPYCEKYSFRLIDALAAPSTDYFHSLMDSTKERWQTWLPDKPQFPIGANSTEEWVAVYTPETAVAISLGQLKTSMNLALRGWAPYRRRRVPAGVYPKPGRSSDSTGGGGMGGDSSPGGGGDGGGCGGGGGDGGGG